MPKDSIGPKIKEFRKSRKMTQEDLAKVLGYSGKSVIAHIEKGDADMTYEKILLLLRTYMLDANDLFEVRRIDEWLEKDREEAKKNRKVVVYIHGLHGSAEESRDFCFFGDEFDVVGLDYQDGNPWEVGPLVQKGFQKLIEHYGGVVVIANSIGAFYAYEYLSEFSISHAYFISPIADMTQIIVNQCMDNGILLEELKEKQMIVLEDGTVLSQDFLKRVERHDDRWNVPTDILYGSKDELVHLENIADFLGRHPKARLTVMEGAGHFFHTDEEKAFIRNWILGK